MFKILFYVIIKKYNDKFFNTCRRLVVFEICILKCISSSYTYIGYTFASIPNRFAGARAFLISLWTVIIFSRPFVGTARACSLSQFAIINISIYRSTEHGFSSGCASGAQHGKKKRIERGDTLDRVAHRATYAWLEQVGMCAFMFMHTFDVFAFASANSRNA